MVKNNINIYLTKKTVNLKLFLKRFDVNDFYCDDWQPHFREGSLAQASTVFLTQDLCGRRFLCYLVSYRHQLRCVKFDESNDKSQLIFGSTSFIQARDAAALPVSHG